MPLLTRAQQAMADQRAVDVAAAAQAAKTAADTKRLAGRAAIAVDVAATAGRLADLARAAADSAADPRAARLIELRRQGISLAAAFDQIEKEFPS